LDGWTSPSGKSLWNFIIHLGNGRDILWKIRDFSGESHTAEFLAQQIQLIIEEIGIQKFAGIVTDAGSNVHSARNLISGKFPHILNIRCIAHSLNLITKDLIKHTFAKKIIQWSCQYQRIQSAAARIWQQMLKISNIAAYLKKFNHTKKQSAEILLAQIGEFYLQSVPYNTPYNSQLVSSPPVDDDREQVPSQNLEILQVLDLDLMFRDNLTDKQLELDGIDDFIQELDKEDDFDPDLL
ncbi:23131_t:CDS:2, partial [Rhizophagus irregularis]